MSDEPREEVDKIVKQEKTVDRENVINRASKYTYSFQNFRAIKTFGRDIYSDKITLKEADEDQASLLVEIMNFKKKLNHRKNRKEKMFFKTCITVLRAEKKSLMLLTVKYFP